MNVKHFVILFALFMALSFFLMGAQALDLIYYAIRSFVRMIAAYAISIVFSFVFGILIIHNKKAYDFIFPVLDILQAIPILGFFPFAILFFVRIFPGGFLGEELSAVFLIFTSMTWAVVFAVVESSASITNEIRDLAKILELRGMRYITQVVLPLSFPQFVSGSIAGWGGGWYFLVAAEYLSSGNDKIALPGLGAFISESAFSYNIPFAFLGIGMLAFIVMGLNFFLWQPLLSRARGLLVKSLVGDEPEIAEHTALEHALEKIYGKFISILERFHKPTQKIFHMLSIDPSHSTSHENVSSAVQYALTFAVLLVFLYLVFFKMPNLLDNLAIISYILHSIGRILVAFALALTWTSLVALFLARNKKMISIIVPLFDIAQSIPAVSVFPVIVILVVQTLGGGLGLEIASILLVMTGMQWYLLFNLIRAVQNIPDEILDISNLFSLKTFNRLKHIMVPAIMPAVFVGGLEAMGGGWNASIVSEYIIGPEGKPFHMDGLGYLLSSSSAAGNLDGVIISVCAITLLILIPNQLIWKPMVRESYKYKF